VTVNIESSRRSSSDSRASRRDDTLREEWGERVAKSLRTKACVFKVSLQSVINRRIAPEVTADARSIPSVTRRVREYHGVVLDPSSSTTL
jgi:hypothetical protein